ncbi:MBL fold metallo-hydrolase [Nitratireductor sp. XY-223]|uniref:MBL fold metallo-hydrolase n=1 Tax=Nitratireductor sp. XY-223 TaxID=2561926 RepID=UPI00145ABD9C|nr:MBL fold metallo-hydrolase [Nitratireductor sp. XY-223]
MLNLCAIAGIGLALSVSAAAAEPCMKVTLTGTQGGPPLFNGQAGAGTLVQYGDETNGCSAVKLQFDTGRGTNMRLSQMKVPVGKIDAIFFTHMHSDHTEGLHDILQLRWHFNSGGPKVDVVCSDDAKSPLGHTLSCSRYVTHIGDSLIESGEIAQRLAENKKRLAGGPADLVNVMTFAPGGEPVEVWQKGDVKVSAIGSRHIPGHASYRVDTPAGSVVVGGDAGNDKPAPPRSSSTSEQVEKLAAGADVLVHSTIHPVMGPDKDSGFPPPIYFRQSNAADLGALSKRAGVKNLVLTHLIPPMGAAKQGPYPIPGGALDEAAYKDAVSASGFEGNTVVGTDLVTITLPEGS